MKAKILILILSCCCLLSCQQAGVKSKSNKKDSAIYTCTMDTTVRSARTGKCPICGMNLVKKNN